LKTAGIDDKEFMQKWVQIDSRLIRPGEINSLCANFTKATTEIGWAPKTHFSAMVAEMVKSEMDKIE
jgi:GDPmannose 4,6-dehydratase